jgi:BlaI family penicillinase repressor
MVLKSSKRQLLTPQELEIMKVVWEAPEVTVRDVYEILRRRRTLAYTTVMTLMQILEKKGHLKRSTEGRQHIYRPARPRKQTVSALLGDFMDRVFNGSTRPLLVHLVEEGRLSKDDLDELRTLIKERKS